jgi:iodotyrosine deiodinase
MIGSMAKKRWDGLIPYSGTRTDSESGIMDSKRYLDIMSGRRTIRDFSTRPVDIGIIRNCVATAGQAPSGANKQPWHFVVITNPETKRRIRRESENIEKRFYQQVAGKRWGDDLKPLATNWEKPFLSEAPVLIAVFLRKFEVIAGGGKAPTYYPSESVGLATGFLISALHQAGLGTLTYTPNPMGFLSDFLERPDNERPYMLVVCGYPADGAMVPDIGKKKLEEIMTLDS